MEQDVKETNSAHRGGGISSRGKLLPPFAGREEKQKKRENRGKRGNQPAGRWKSFGIEGSLEKHRKCRGVRGRMDLNLTGDEEGSA